MYSKESVVLFDGSCKLCVRYAKLLQACDWFGRFICLDFRREQVSNVIKCVSAEQLEEQMVLITSLGEIKFGFKAWRYIVRGLPLFFVPAHLLYLPVVSQLGDRLYRMIARSRLGLVHCPPGQCTDTYTASGFELELEGPLLDGIRIANNRIVG